MGGIMGAVMKDLIPGALAGVAAPIANKYVPGWGAPLAYGGIGYFMKNSTLMTLAGIAAGQNIAPMVSNMLPGGNTTNTGAFL